MKPKSYIAWLSLALLSTSAPLWAEPQEAPAASVEKPAPNPEPDTSVEPVGALPVPEPRALMPSKNEEDGETEAEVEAPLESDLKLLQVAARIDAAYLAGTGIQQGFSIPSLRLVAMGDVGELVHYRLALGETREYSSALLPQILPQAAYIDLQKMPHDGSAGSELAFRMGMFLPMLNPFWSYDLMYVDLPTYHETQRAMLLPPDLGAEISYRPIGERLVLSIGMFNGNGNYSLNVNGSKAFTAFLKALFPLGRAKLILGTGAYTVSQSEPGDTNYRSNWASDSFVTLEAHPLTVSFDVMAGTFEDATRSVSPFGAAGFVHLSLGHDISLFSRFEMLSASPITGGTLTHAQIGPELELAKALKTFVVYDYLDAGNGVLERSLQVRVRLTL